jgi:hypothetical protein
MKFSMTSALFAAALLLGASSQAQAVVLTFDDVVAPQLNSTFSTFDYGGLTFSAGAGSLAYIFDAGSPNSNGSNNLIFAAFPSNTMTITQTGGGLFDLGSIDLAISWYDSSPSGTITINGSPLTITQTLTTYTLNLLGVSSVVLTNLPTGGYWLADNINTSASAVPIPAALPLMAMGLAALGVAGRRRKQMTPAA